MGPSCFCRGVRLSWRGDLCPSAAVHRLGGLRPGFPGGHLTLEPCRCTGRREELKVEVTSENKITSSEELCKITGEVTNQSQEECAGDSAAKLREAPVPECAWPQRARRGPSRGKLNNSSFTSVLLGACSECSARDRRCQTWRRPYSFPNSSSDFICT